MFDLLIFGFQKLQELMLNHSFVLFRFRFFMHRGRSRSIQMPFEKDRKTKSKKPKPIKTTDEKSVQKPKFLIRKVCTNCGEIFECWTFQSQDVDDYKKSLDTKDRQGPWDDTCKKCTGWCATPRTDDGTELQKNIDILRKEYGLPTK